MSSPPNHLKTWLREGRVQRCPCSAEVDWHRGCQEHKFDVLEGYWTRVANIEEEAIQAFKYAQMVTALW